MRNQTEMDYDDAVALVLVQSRPAVTIPLDAPEGEGTSMKVWYDHKRNRTYSEVCGAYIDMGAWWCDGIIDSEQLIIEFYEEIGAGKLGKPIVYK
jgi:hypothetical protein